MARQTPTAAAQDPMAGWWPSRYGARAEAGAPNEIPGRTFRQYLTTNYHHINRRGPGAGPAGLGRNSVGATSQAAAQPLVTAHA